MKYIAVFLAFVILLMCFLPACSKNDDFSSATINYNLDYEPKALDPQIATDSSSRIVIRNMYEGLTSLDENMNVIPAVASSWESNSDFTEYTFHLREDATWTDASKTKVTANDFVFALRRVVDPKTQSALAENLMCIKNAGDISSSQMQVADLGVKAVDDYTLKITLEYSNDKLPQLLTSTACMPCNEKFFNECNGQYGLECDKTLGNGYFEFTNKYSWDHKKTISLSRNSNHYGGKSTSIPANISFTIGSYTSSTSSLTTTTNDVITVTDSNLEKVKKSGMRLTSFEDTTWGICFNMDNKIVQNDNIRIGLMGVFDKDNMIKNVPEGYTKAEDVIAPMTTVNAKNYRELVGTGSANVTVSNPGSLLQSGMTECNLESLEITILCADDVVSKMVASNTIETLNKSLGGFFNIEPVSTDELDNRISTSDYQIALLPVKADIDGPVNFLTIFKSNNKNNVAGLNNADYDALLTKASNGLQDGDLQYCVQAEKFLVENAVFYPLCYKNTYFATESNVSGERIYSYNEGIDFSHTVKSDKD